MVGCGIGMVSHTLVFFGILWYVYSLIFFVMGILGNGWYGIVQSRILLRLHPSPSHNYYAPHTATYSAEQSAIIMRFRCDKI